MMKRSIKVFADFDGTITTKDLGDEIFKEFGDFDTWHSKLNLGEISIKEYWHSICGTFDKNISAHDIENYALSAEYDPYFLEFIKLLAEHNLKLTVVSDGFKEYIAPVLNKIAPGKINYYANRLDFSNIIKPVFYGADESCNCMSASCKRNVLINNSQEEDVIVYIGDGYSDFCAAEHADIIFAKKHLARYCNENKVPHYPFIGFFDVIEIFKKKILSGINVKQRRQAVVKRKQAIETE